MLSIWVSRICWNWILKSQILRLFGICVARLRNWLSKFENHKSSGGLRCDEGGNCVDLGAQNVPKWGSEIADSRRVSSFSITVAELAKHSIPQFSIAEPTAV